MTVQEKHEQELAALRTGVTTLLARMPENLQGDIAQLKQQLRDVKEDTEAMGNRLDNDYISRKEFEARMKLADWVTYGVLGIIGVAVIGALLKLILGK